MINVYHQTSLGGSDTLRSEELYELAASEVGYKTKMYRGDNGIFKTKSFNANSLTSTKK